MVGLALQHLILGGNRFYVQVVNVESGKYEEMRLKNACSA